MVALAVLLLVQRGALSLSQRVAEFLPEFKEAAKRPITIRHLLSHTSGLPDMLPENAELRSNQATLSQFVEQTCRTELLFPPGRGAQYQSMGYALLGPILDVVSGEPHQQFIRRELFERLNMSNAWLGLPEEMLNDPRIAEIRVPPWQAEGTHWNWNSPYWRRLGAPWGGVICTLADLSRFCRCWLTGGQDASGQQFISPALIREASSNRLGDFSAIPQSECRTRGWGLGWRMNWKVHRSVFSDLLPDDAYGHWGATGTLFWIDPHSELCAVIVSTAPMNDEVSPLTRLSNMIAAALTDTMP
jgi:CubicO group peptidase (beta-lactamase class C family)